MLTASDAALREAAIFEAISRTDAAPRDPVRSRILHMAGGTAVSLAALQFAQASLLRA